LKDQDARITALRHIATQWEQDVGSPDTFIIRYMHHSLQPSAMKDASSRDNPRLSNPNIDNDSSRAVDSLNELSSRRPSPYNDFAKSDQTVQPVIELKSGVLNEESDESAKPDSDVNLEDAISDDECHESEYFEDNSEDLHFDIDMDDSEGEQSPSRHPQGQSPKLAQCGEYAFATALPWKSQNPSQLSTPNPSHQSFAHHHRWLPGPPQNAALVSGETYTLDAAERFNSWDDCIEILGAEEEFSYAYLLGTHLKQPSTQDVAETYLGYSTTL